MGWPYQFLSLDQAERHARREVLNRYAAYAQLSALLPVTLFLLCRIASWARKSVAEGRRGSYGVIPNSPSLKVQHRTAWGAWSTQARKLGWWLRDDIYIFGRLYGQRDQWIFGSLWAAWMLVLCVVGTGHDYLHLTKRFGAIAVSQLPILYLMSLKSLNPFVYVFRSSHEQVNRMHRALGRVIYTLLCLHAAFYINYFVGVGILGKRFFAPIVFAGVVAFLCLSLLSVTALQSIRRFSYRAFFVTHLTAALVMPVLVFFHARPARLFVGEALIVFLADLVSRKMDTIVSQATLESIPGTDLVKISASVPYGRANKFRAHPGSHIYLSVPAAARPSSNPASLSFLLFEFLFNPFTVAAVDEETGDITLVARRMGGPLTAALARFAARQTPVNASNIAPREEGKIPLCIEGPYGIVKHFPNLAGGEFSRILLVAGGIGATFTVPLYRSIAHDNPNAKVEMIWAVRGAADATWAVAATGAGKSILNDDNVHIFLTGDIVDSVAGAASVPGSGGSWARMGGSNGERNGSAAGETDSEVEMSSMYRDRRRNRYTSHHNRKRPDLKKIVDDIFRYGSEERVAILVCGPDDMARELREHVGVWAMKGRSIWFHNEGFGL
ncbi:hypothetical protein QBC33DRAFT_541034 [Phialemonium atrogriseum]|uniref:FAD-binding FR-type domain-containing protein n=1 Tax=Phialemonium atrogriseum TaxID=1093897 RepID=A0AAJ0BXR2_9PEZI|nr:uncharacterized protein QBC33DRAFT_541034 [Phialemonium atrogriseum]KAK1766434.1 hypothetical protein QBC33DRAFT_541034 [Phialemonium atrogriseum]